MASLFRFSIFVSEMASVYFYCPMLSPSGMTQRSYLHFDFSSNSSTSGRGEMLVTLKTVKACRNPLSPHIMSMRRRSIPPPCAIFIAVPVILLTVVSFVHLPVATIPQPWLQWIYNLWPPGLNKAAILQPTLPYLNLTTCPAPISSLAPSLVTASLTSTFYPASSTISPPTSTVTTPSATLPPPGSIPSSTRVQKRNPFKDFKVKSFSA